MTYPIDDGLKPQLDALYTTAGNAVSDLAGVVAGADVLASQFADVKNALADLQSFVDNFGDGYYYTPVGVVVPFAGSSSNKPTSGWLLCDGSSISTSTYDKLFAVIGYGFGGSGVSFSLPDLRGRTVLGAGTGAGLSVRALAQSFGTEEHALTPGETAIRSHTHDMKNHTHGGTTGYENQTHIHTLAIRTRNNYSLTGSGEGFYSGGSFSTVGPVGGHTHNFSTGGPSDNTTNGTSEVNGSVHNNMQPSLVLNYLIKV